MVKQYINKYGKRYILLATSLFEKTSDQKKLKYKKLYKSVITIKEKNILFGKKRVDHYYLYGNEKI